MKKAVSGINYSFIIQKTLNEKNSYCFQIICRHKISKRMSGITNMNFILSNIVSQVINEKKVEDSWIDTNKIKSCKLFEIATDRFNDKDWIKHLECELDKDRIIGEWD